MIVLRGILFRGRPFLSGFVPFFNIRNEGIIDKRLIRVLFKVVE
jgi:hypothetical protein